MKKILLATTHLSMAAGFAAADVAVSGSAKMGVVSTDGTAAFKHNVVIKFKGTGTTDGGLAFGGSVDADDSIAAEAGTKGTAFISGAFGKITMGAVDSGDGASVGQLAAVGYTSLSSGNSISYAADGSALAGLSGTQTDAGGAKVLYTYSAGALTINASTAQLSPAAGGATAYGIGGSYTTGGLTMAVGYGSVTGGTMTGVKAYDSAQAAVAAVAFVNGVSAGSSAIVAAPAAWYETSALDASVTDVSLSATYVMDNTSIKAIYQIKTLDATAAARTDVTPVVSVISTAGVVTTPAIGQVHGHGAIDLSTKATSMGLSVVQKMDALSLTAYGINTTIDADADLSADNPTVSRYGIGFAYNLGGGATVAGGWATVDAMIPAVAAADPSGLSASNVGLIQKSTLTSVSHDQFDLGLNFSF